MGNGRTLDTFDAARRFSCIGLVVAALIGCAGALADWVTIEPPPIVPPSQRERTRPFTGIEAGDGWWVVTAGMVFIVAAAGLWLRARRRYAWVAFLAAILGGGVVVADYRGIGDITSSLAQRVDWVGAASPAIGITLAAAGMIAGLLAAVGALVATPADRET